MGCVFVCVRMWVCVCVCMYSMCVCRGFVVSQVLQCYSFLTCGEKNNQNSPVKFTHMVLRRFTWCVSHIFTCNTCGFIFRVIFFFYRCFISFVYDLNHMVFFWICLMYHVISCMIHLDLNVSFCFFVNILYTRLIYYHTLMFHMPHPFHI